MKKALWPALAGVALLVMVFYGWYYFPRGGRPSPDELQQQALSAATPQEQQAAAAQLCDWGEVAKPQLRNVLQSSDSPEVKSMIVLTLGSLHDFDSMDLLIAGLNDPSLDVREQSLNVLRRMLGQTPPYDPNGPEAGRQKAIDVIRKDWEKLKASSALEDFKQRLKNGTAYPPEAQF